MNMTPEEIERMRVAFKAGSPEIELRLKDFTPRIPNPFDSFNNLELILMVTAVVSDNQAGEQDLADVVFEIRSRMRPDDVSPEEAADRKINK